MSSVGPIRIGIVDDEPLARDEMRRLLRMFDDVNIEFEAENAEAAIRNVRAFKPDLLFLDIGLPDVTGLHIASILAKDDCMIVFCTADPAHALEAFDLNAIDYLHKPIELHRLSQALEKYRSVTKVSDSSNGSKHLNMEKPILINDGEKTQIFTPNQIESIVSIGNYVKLKGINLNIVAQHTMSYIEGRLSSDVFFRANRSTIINLSKVAKVEFSVSGNYMLIMDSGEVITVSRRQSAQMKNVLKL
ncbi:MAG: DNA-binding response regulator [Blastopirellula sp.]|nr:MAG: DNA-binding response regulator [Blastopirellula sp.]